MRFDEQESLNVIQTSRNHIMQRVQGAGFFTCVSSQGLIYCHLVGSVQCPDCSDVFHRLMSQCICGYQPSLLSGEILAIDSPDSTRLATVEQVMKKFGAPTIRALQQDGKIYALEGSQRLAVAKQLDLTPRIVMMPGNYSMLWSDWGNPLQTAQDWFDTQRNDALGRWRTSYIF